MIELYTWTTPNGQKPLIMLEEVGLPYRVHPVDIGKGAQHEPAYLAINPNSKIPALVDRPEHGDPVHVFESGAILIYLAEKTGKLLPDAGQARADTFAWLMFQMSAVGPMFGQYGHFTMVRPDVEYGKERYGKEVERIAGVLEHRLALEEYLAGPYTIADIATYPWSLALQRYGVDMARFPNLAGWQERIGAREAVKKARAWRP